jgi:predicted PurR-regulated permease PerM
MAPEVDESAKPAQSAEGAPADLSRSIEAVRSDDAAVQDIGITGLFIIAAFFTLYLAREFFLPVAYALLLDFVFSPVVRALRRLRIPSPVGAALVILLLIGTVGFIGYQLTEPAQAWVAKAPQTMNTVTAKLRKIRRPVEQVSRTAEQVERATTVNAPARTPEVVVRGPSLGERLFGTTQRLVTALLEVLVLLYFLLAAGDLFLQKLIKVLPQLRDKKTAVQIARRTEASISTYLLTVALVNITEGLVVAGAMWLLGMPNPLLWGALAALFECVPYLGATGMIGILALAGLTTFDDVGHALLVPATFFAINVIQANLISPLILGHRLTLNPVAILLGLIFWWWLWGVPGAFIAVPLMATFKILCDHIEVLAPIGEFLGR